MQGARCGDGIGGRCVVGWNGVGARWGDEVGGCGIPGGC